MTTRDKIRNMLDESLTDSWMCVSEEYVDKIVSLMATSVDQGSDEDALIAEVRGMIEQKLELVRGY